MKGLAGLLFGAGLTSRTAAVKSANFESETLIHYATLCIMPSCICQTQAVTQVLAMP